MTVDVTRSLSNETIHDLNRQAAEVRLQIVRAMGPGQLHHFGGSLSIADILVARRAYLSVERRCAGKDVKEDRVSTFEGSPNRRGS